MSLENCEEVGGACGGMCASYVMRDGQGPSLAAFGRLCTGGIRGERPCICRIIYDGESITHMELRVTGIAATLRERTLCAKI